MNLSIADIDDAARRAADRLRGRVVRTRLIEYPELSAAIGADVRLKLENEQHTGSFKLRGALNRLLTLDDETRARGVTVASSGNHGAASARAMSELSVPGVVFVPEHVSAAKLDAIQKTGVDVRLHGKDGLDTELYAREYAAANGLFYLSPYNDPEVIAGQGSIGVELLEQCPDLDAVIIAVGGGGLLSGVASVLKRQRPGIRVIAVQPGASAVMARSVEAGGIVAFADEPTLSDGTAGGIEEGAITFEPVRELADEFVLIDEFDIANALCRLETDTDMLVEGAAALTTAAALMKAESLAGQKVVALICGGNIADETAETARQLVRSA